MITSGARVYAVGAVTGSAPSYKLPLAWIDPPAEVPAPASITAHTVLEAYAAPSVSQAFAGPSGALVVELADQAKFFPMAIATAPLDDLASLALFPSPGIPNGGAPVTMSGARALVYRWSNDNNMYDARFSLETSAGTANAQSTSETSILAAMGPTLPAPAFAQGPDGSVLFSAPSVVVNDAGDPVIRALRMTWLLAGATAAQPDASMHVDVETYQPALASSATITGPLAFIDANDALVLASAAGTQNQTSVQVAAKSPSPPSLLPKRRHVLPINVTATGAAASNGFAYVLTADAPDSATLHVFAPACTL
jgi:hypothetical protein